MVYSRVLGSAAAGGRQPQTPCQLAVLEENQVYQAHLRAMRTCAVYMPSDMLGPRDSTRHDGRRQGLRHRNLHVILERPRPGGLSPVLTNMFLIGKCLSGKSMKRPGDPLDCRWLGRSSQRCSGLHSGQCVHRPDPRGLRSIALHVVLDTPQERPTEQQFLNGPLPSVSTATLSGDHETFTCKATASRTGAESIASMAVQEQQRAGHAPGPCSDSSEKCMKAQVKWEKDGVEVGSWVSEMKFTSKPKGYTRKADEDLEPRASERCPHLGSERHVLRDMLFPSQLTSSP
ncbi:Protein Ddi1-like 1 [Manis pentadactyla]|nr:Protein Ddi1-like 1 [Manis pentadactyla]